MDRILTTHVGSLIRPQALLDFLAAMERGESYDEAAYEQALADAVADVVRRQAEAGIDVDRRRRDGQGDLDHVPLRARERPRAAAWCRSRAATSCRRAATGRRSRSSTPSTTQQYARTMVETMRRLAERPEPERRRDRGRGKLLVLHGADRVRQRRARARHRALQGALGGVDVVDASSRSSRRRASYWLRNEYYATEEEFVFALADALHEEYQGDRRRRLPAPGRRRRAAARVRLDPLARRLGRGLPPLGGAARRGAQPRARGDPGGPDPLPRLLRELARPARLRPAARAR